MFARMCVHMHMWLGQLRYLFYIIGVICSETCLPVFHLTQGATCVSSSHFVTRKGNSKGVFLKEQFTE